MSEIDDIKEFLNSPKGYKGNARLDKIAGLIKKSFKGYVTDVEKTFEGYVPAIDEEEFMDRYSDAVNEMLQEMAESLE